MFSRKGVFSSIGRAGAVAAVAAMALTAVEPSMAFAGSAPSPKNVSKGVTASTGTSDATDISARRRYYRGGGGGAAAAAAFAGIVGTGIAIAASQNRRDYYDNGYYGGGPAYYGNPTPYYYPPATYYGGQPYYRSSVPHYRGHPLASW
ncbi:MAG: hypothetical protein PS018_23320 [bacterium]|nr:hypothetical protein [bacterium]